MIVTKPHVVELGRAREIPVVAAAARREIVMVALFFFAGLVVGFVVPVARGRLTRGVIAVLVVVLVFVLGVDDVIIVIPR